MHDARQSAVARHTLQQMLCPEGENIPYVLTLLTYHFVGMEEGISLIREAGRESMRLEVTAENHVYRYFDKAHLVNETENDSWHLLSAITEERIREADFILLPVLSFSLVSDILHFNDRRDIVRIVLQSLLAGKKVVALSCGADPYHSLFSDAELNQGNEVLVAELMKQLILLKKFGIEVRASIGEIINLLNRNNDARVITEADVKAAAASGHVSIIAGKNSIVTPLALDTARSCNIEIVRK